jgi:RNA polymerase sigma-70 factor (ECF subfamily)
MPVEVADLVAAAQAGDREAFDELVRATYADTYTLAYRLTGDEEDARDVVQEAYLRRPGDGEPRDPGRDRGAA